MNKKSVRNEVLEKVRSEAVKRVHIPQSLSAKYIVRKTAGRIVIASKSNE